MISIREKLNQSPWIGWALAGVLLMVSVALYFVRSPGSGVEFSQEQMTEMVTVKFTDTGDEMVLPRGRFEKMLRDSARGTLDPTRGLINPKTNQATGFLFDKSDWEKSIDRINRARKELGTDTASGEPAAASRPDAGLVTPPAETPSSPAPQPK